MMIAITFYSFGLMFPLPLTTRISSIVTNRCLVYVRSALTSRNEVSLEEIP